MIFKSHVFDEPMLEFGDGGQHCDPRQGLREFGPLQPRSGDVVRVGVIGTEDTVSGFTEFLAETAGGIESENKQLINLNPISRALATRTLSAVNSRCPTVRRRHSRGGRSMKLGRSAATIRQSGTQSS
jgi:hypothetical protein